MLFQACPICVARRLPIKRGMAASVVVEGHPVLDEASCLEPVGDFLKVDGLLFQASPEPFDEDVVEIVASTMMPVLSINRCSDPLELR